MFFMICVGDSGGVDLVKLIGKLHEMDRSPIRQTFELGKFISTAGKSILDCEVWLQNIVKCHMKFVYFVYSLTLINISKCGNAFPCVMQRYTVKYTKFANFT